MKINEYTIKNQMLLWEKVNNVRNPSRNQFENIKDKNERLLIKIKVNYK